MKRYFLTLFFLFPVILMPAAELDEAFYRSRLDDKSLTPELRLAYMDSILHLVPSDYRMRQMKAQLSYSLGRYDVAAREYMETAKIVSMAENPFRHLWAMLMAGHSLWLSNRRIDAGKMALDIVQTPKPDSLEYFDIAATGIAVATAIESGDLDAASEWQKKYFQDYDRLYKSGLIPKHVATDLKRTGLGNQTDLLIAQKKYKEALATANNILQFAESFTDTVNVQGVRAKIYASIGEHEAAKSLYQESIRRNRLMYNRRIHGNEYAELLMKMNAPQEALEMLDGLDMSDSYDPVEVKRLKIKGAALNALGKFKEAYECLNDASVMEDSLTRNGQTLSVAVREFENGITQEKFHRLEGRLNRWKVTTIILISAMVLGLIGWGITVIYRKHQRAAILNHEHATDSPDSRRLVSATLQMARLNDSISAISDLAQSGRPEALDKIRTELKSLDYSVNTWEVFRSSFESLHPGFFDALLRDTPGLKTGALRMAAYIVLGLTNKEIATLLNRQPRTVETIKYRLRKEMRIPADVPTHEFLRRYLPIREEPPQ